MENGWVFIIAALVAAPGTYAAYLSWCSNKVLRTPGRLTIGEQVDALQADQLVLREELASIAEAKVLADARLASAALAAIARLAPGDSHDAMLLEAAGAAAERVEVEAERVARRKGREEVTR